MHHNTKDPLYTVAEAIRLTKIGKTKFYQEVASGNIKALKIGSRTLIPAQSVNDWIEALSPLNNSQEEV